MKNKIIKVSLIVLAILLILSVAIYYSLNESKPIGKKGDEAEVLAKNLLTNVNDSAWLKTGAIKWNFANRHKLIWDKNRHFTKVIWNDYVAYVDINSRTGTAFKNEIKLKNEEANKIINQAWKIWVNDSFWLNPVSKVFDEGTERSIVTLDNGKKALQVTYTSGGDTPGDSYLWEIGTNGLPYNWKMWVSIIPIGGVNTTWEEWITLSTGAKISTLHKTSLFDIKITDVKAANSLVELEGEDVFAGFLK